MRTDFDELIERALLDPPSPARSIEWFRDAVATRRRRRRVVVIAWVTVSVTGAAGTIALVGEAGDGSIAVSGGTATTVESSTPLETAATATPTTVRPSNARLEVPNLVGLPLDDAERQLADLTLTWVVVDAPSDDVPAGLVYESVPPPGELVASGDRVVLTVSSGPSVTAPPTTTVPSTTPPIVCPPSPGLSAEAIPLNTIVTQIAIDEATSPVAVTGARIGDPIADVSAPGSVASSGSGDRAPFPLWVTVGSGGVVVGYVYTPNSFARDPLPPDLQNPDCHPELSIYDEAGLLIGGFIDGVPVITE